MFEKTLAIATAVALAGCSSFDGRDDRHEPIFGNEVTPSSSADAPTPHPTATTTEGVPTPAAVSTSPQAAAVTVATALPVPTEGATTGRACIEARLDAAGDAGAPGSSDVAAGIDGGVTTGAGDSLVVDLGTGDLTVLVIFDKSGSMSSPWDERTKWQVANDAFEKGLVGILDVVTVGAVLFPQPGDCLVAPLDSELQFGFSSGRTFWSRWEQTAAGRVPAGSTPLELAMRTADQAIEAACNRGLLDRRFRVLLVTDGEPTCDDNLPAIVALAGEWGRIGIEIRVLGLPGSAAAADLLNAIANGGGTVEYQALDSTGALDDGVYAALR
jgi:hypothetical protein